MKTLDEIINNENYNRLNNALEKRSIEIAEKIASAMIYAEIKEIGDYKIIKSKLHILNEKEGYDNLENYFEANGKQRLKFLNDAKSILEEIDNIKQKHITDVENALKAAESL